LGRDIYICGGYDGTQLRSLEMWSCNTWTTLASMSQRRDELSLTVGPDLSLYAIGGFGDGTILSSCERYNIGEDTWSSIPHLSSPRRALSAVALPDGIYVIGGYDGSKYLKSLDKFDIRKNSWIQLAPMNEARCTLAAVVSPDCQYIYALGGFNGSPLASVERYSILENSWETIAPLPAPKFMHSAVIFSD
jgi:N-acetylneuraminic acid mutarotase